MQTLSISSDPSNVVSVVVTVRNVGEVASGTTVLLFVSSLTSLCYFTRTEAAILHSMRTLIMGLVHQGEPPVAMNRSDTDAKTPATVPQRSNSSFLARFAGFLK